jgi:hypothetical protein
VAIAAVIAWFAYRRAPQRDWRPTIHVDAHLPGVSLTGKPERIPMLSGYLFEKVALIALIAIIFSQVLPNTDAGVFQVVVGVALVVVANAAASQWLSARGHSWSSTGQQLIAMLVVNFLIVSAYGLLLRVLLDRRLDVGALFFMILLLTLIVTLFDRYKRRQRAIRLGQVDEPATPPPAAAAAEPQS